MIKISREEHRHFQHLKRKTDSNRDSGNNLTESERTRRRRKEGEKCRSSNAECKEKFDGTTKY